MNKSMAVVCVVGAVLVAGCGGGGDSGTPSAGGSAATNVANQAPVANAGANQVVGRGAVVTLDARGSTDADGDALTYRWAVQSVPAGSRAALSDPRAAGPTFTADVDGTYIFSLAVSDGKAESAPATVSVETCGVAPASAGRRSPLLISCG